LILLLSALAAGASPAAPSHASARAPRRAWCAAAVSLPRLTPERFGAKGDGIADDSGAINRAFAALKAAGGGTLSLGAGKTYLVGSSLGSGPTRRFIDNVTVEGNGATIKNNGPSKPSGRFYTLRLLGSRVTVRNLNFGWTHRFNFATDNPDNKGNGRGEVNALDVGGTYPTAKSDILVENVKVYGAWYSGIRPRYSSHVVIRNCSVRQALATAIFPGDMIDDVAVENCSTTDSKDDGIYVGSGRLLPAVRNARVTGCTVKNSWARGIGFGGVLGGVIEGNTIDNSYVAGITLDAGSNASSAYSPEGTKQIRIRDNVIRNAGWNYKAARGGHWARASSIPHGIYSSTGATTGKIASVEIEGNTITHVRGAGIAVAGVRGLTVRDTRILDASGGGISVGYDAAPDGSNVRDFSITGNEIRRVGGSGIYVSHAGAGTIRDNTVGTYGSKGGPVDRGVMAYRCDGVRLGPNRIINDNGAEEEVSLAGSKNVTREAAPAGASP
jgi:hypothetical protein